MILRFFRRDDGRETIQRLYGAIVAHSRDPSFYTAYGVPDTIEGRFEMILVHAFLLFHRLKSEGEEQRALGQRVFDAFCVDMDANLREMGVSDVAVPKRMKKVAESFYGRVGAYDGALDRDDAQALAESVLRNVFGSDSARGAEARAMAAYIGEAARSLAALPFATLAAGEFPLPAPAGFISEERSAP
ncbi:ubiquinol-cytochrome C chaperone [Ancylobacter sp. MQZ15Z-1]|uniref:Ubiquinol-cytochrome C chaperone n=1 Tax=Ancylobacter mangrovi TaxID=2972472 RepID=A0A9X2PE37_9HYPH|nr:ubiquinol-cytochrome C chaperone family protein [Ancylobacter mangrovi]MCS0496991.1 ubiquinol-cytochrome C chaperone [Ancylobacter mangrovi]